ncbi:hypothetical protein HQ393_13235 [Chitinibacter bivalviorum]|uniref:Uncharacterized protein n=1 Tax=Chitinibacter bivalviorum TaxID=2739434 RepID=A0A7H9BLH0_9NEIS|nr:hypothetical protein [Chitinibacter bivalviorum]QLG89128.1 hypothetical protein HQ393_13235 [Chitinibacter bivalviorum]
MEEYTGYFLLMSPVLLGLIFALLHKPLTKLCSCFQLIVLRLSYTTLTFLLLSFALSFVFPGGPRYLGSNSHYPSNSAAYFINHMLGNFTILLMSLPIWVCCIWLIKRPDTGRIKLGLLAAATLIVAMPLTLIAGCITAGVCV